MEVQKLRDPKKDREQYFIDYIFQEMVEAYERRKAEDPNYSLRAFSKALNIDSTFMSRLIRKKSPLTYKTALRLANEMGLPSHVIIDRFDSKRSLPSEVFRPISRWYYFAILECRKLLGFKPNASWISKKLNLPKSLVSQAIEQLVSHQHIKIDKGKWKIGLDEARWQEGGDLTELKKSYQLQISRLSSHAIADLPVDKRDAYSLTIAASPEALPLIRQKIRNLSEEIALICDNTKYKSDVYVFHANFFPMKNYGEEGES